MWVRGLKLFCVVSILCILVSHPMWVRGLKLFLFYLCTHEKGVAPHVGAWIETQNPYQ